MTRSTLCRSIASVATLCHRTGACLYGESPRYNWQAMNRLLEYLDRLQRRHHWLALPFAVFKRFGEHGGGRLATTISYWSFFSIFPLLLAFVTVLNAVLEDDEQRRRELVDGAMGQVPVIGSHWATRKRRSEAAGRPSSSACSWRSGPAWPRPTPCRRGSTRSGTRQDSIDRTSPFIACAPSPSY